MIRFASLLVIVFVTLKLCGVIAWSWIWVLSPLWIPIAMLPMAVLLVLLILAGAALLGGRPKVRTTIDFLQEKIEKIKVK